MKDSRKSTATVPSHYLILSSILIWVVGALALPITQDEAYYSMWAKNLSWGYFDHPPAVALAAIFGSLVESSAFFSRLGTIILAIMTVFTFRALVRNSGIQSKKIENTAILLGFFNLMGLVFGFLTTPDTILLFSWTWALSESAAALNIDRRRWLLAGLATGIGLLSKYTMSIIGPVFLLGIIFGDRKALKTPWPYLGGLVALLVFTPQLQWNSNHDNITFQFQFSHGMSTDRPNTGSFLTPPLPEDKNSDEYKASLAFAELEKAEQKEEKQPQFYDSFLKKLNIYIGYYASQVGFWGILIFPLLLLLSKKKSRSVHSNISFGNCRPLLLTSVFFPLFLFGTISLFSKVEANWSAMYLIGASVLLAPIAVNKYSFLFKAAIFNVLALLVLLYHANSGFFAKRPHRDRALQETHGYENLADKLSTKVLPVFADSYQIVSMIRFYDPKSSVTQWPKITRDSEYTRNPNLNKYTMDSLRQMGGFWIVTSEKIPPIISGFRFVALSQLRDCKGQRIQEIEANNFNFSARCRQPIHEWYLVKYEAP